MQQAGWGRAALFLVLAGCATHTVALHGANTTPAAEGELKLKQRESGNTEIRLEVRHLAPAERIKPEAAQYVVWVTPLGESAAPQNVGALLVDDDLRGRLQTVTPLDKFDLFVTPEPSGRAAQPSGPRVLSAAVR